MTRNQVRYTGTQVTIPMLTEPTSTQREAFTLIGTAIPADLEVARTSSSQPGRIPGQTQITDRTSRNFGLMVRVRLGCCGRDGRALPGES